MLRFAEFLYESGINQNVKDLTDTIFQELLKNSFQLLSKSLTFNSTLENKSKNLIFINDTINFISSKYYHANIENIVIKEGVIVNLIMNFELPPTFNYTRIKEDITHELTHVIEYFYSVNKTGNPPKSWETYKKLKKHQDKFKNFTEWIKISHLFYEMLDHEKRSRISQTYQTLKSLNTHNINLLHQEVENTDEWKKMRSILKINPEDILKILKRSYPNNYIDILTDFMNVFDLQYTDKNFIIFFNKLKSSCNNQKKNLGKIATTIAYESNDYVEENIKVDIDEILKILNK